MAKVIVERKSGWTNKGRSIGLYLNNKKIGTIEDGETVTFHLAPGDYVLKAKN